MPTPQSWKSATWLAVSSMAKIYYEAVKAGRRTIESVPKRWREQVRQMIDNE